MDEMKTERAKVRPRYGVAFAILAAAALVGLAVTWHESGRNAAAEPPKETAALPTTDVVETTPDQLQQISVEPVSERTIDLDLETTGKVGFNEDRMTPVFAPYAGRVIEILANKGELVKSGQPLLVLESPEFVSAVNDLAGARADANKARIALDAAEKAAARARTLHDQEAIATKELQAAESELARTRDEYRRSLAALSAVQNRLAMFGKNAEEIAQLESTAADHLDRRVVLRAPLGGTIVDRKVGPGQYIKPDSPDPLYLISDLSIVWVMADVYENYLPHIRIGAPVEIALTSYPDRTFPARISTIDPTVDAATRTVHVRCTVPNPAGLLRPEMFAKIRIAEAVKKSVLCIPSTAVITHAAGSFVLVEESPGHFRRRSVKAGREINGYTVIEDGLRPNDRVVTKGVLLLSNAFES